MASRLILESRKHLDAVGEDYGEHRRFAFTVGAAMVVAGLACIIHSLIPALFSDKASRTINRLHHIVHNREALGPARKREQSPLVVLCCLSFACAALPWIAGAEAIVALPLSLLSLAFVIAYGWSEEGQGDAIERLLPIRLED